MSGADPSRYTKRFRLKAGLRTGGVKYDGETSSTTDAAKPTRRHGLAEPALHRVAGDLRDVAHVDSDRRQDTARESADDQSLVADAPVRHLARPYDLADPLRRAHVPGRFRFY